MLTAAVARDTHLVIMRNRPDDGAPIDALPNLGPAMRRWLAEIDIPTVGALRAIGAVAAYRRLRFVRGRQVTRNALHALDAALRGVDWRQLSQAEKDALDAEVADRPAMVRPPKKKI